MRVLLLSCLVALVGVALADQTPVEGQAGPKTAEVVAPIGKIRGSFNESRLGREFFSARGIRYAEAPVGDLRFRPAVPAKTWATVYDATEEGPACPHPGAILPSEDCLRLNVYSPELPSSEKLDVKKPVLVFFHPGGFYASSGQSRMYGPEFLMDEDIVVVTPNYRLMSLGFISTGDSEAPGNLGLKDQVMALRWIQDNIAAFGGDPKSVTIVGNSAGGWSVSLHMVSPMSKGLFHRAIAMSGAVTGQKLLGGNQIDLAKKQAKLLNCSSDTNQEIISCLRTKPVQAFVDSFIQMFDWEESPTFLWSAVIEPEVPGVERFLTAEPEDLIRQGKFHQVPLITGITKDEYAIIAVHLIEAARKGDNTFADNLNNRWEELAPILFQYERGTPRSKEISKELKSFYFKDQPVSSATADGLAQLYADSIYGFPVHRLAKLIAQASSEPVYYYEFTYQGRVSHNMWSDTKKSYGAVVHEDDLLYLFWLKRNFPYATLDDPEYVTIKRMTSMWSSFAKTGNPIPQNDEGFANVTWEAFTPMNNKYLNIGDTLTMNTSLYSERMNEWEKLFPLYPVADRNTTQH